MMTDTEVREQIDRADRFVEELRAAINETMAAVDPASPCASEARRGLARISATLCEADYVMMSNLSVLDLAMKNRIGTGLLPIIELHLRAVGGGPTHNYENATEFLRMFEPVVDAVRKRRIN
jgi:hypothetical protein